MKNTIKLVALLTLSISVICLAPFLQGCGTVPPGPGPGPINQQTIDAAAVILRGAARAGTIAAITPPTGNANNRAYFELASQGLGTFITGTNYSPAALQQALMDLNSPALKEVYVQIAIGSVVDLYQLYYQQYVAGQLSNSAPVVVEFATAIQDGFNQALGKPPGTRTAVRPHLEQVLPRPCPSRK